jgi:inhibitor of cysteine peptidase
MSTAPRNAVVLASALLIGGVIAICPAPASAQPSSVQLAPGARTTIELPENPSTGYVWRLDTARSVNAAIVQVVDQGFSPATSDRPPIGAPGIHRWSIEALRSGSGKLIFINLRPWEGQPVREHTVAVDVR